MKVIQKGIDNQLYKVEENRMKAVLVSVLCVLGQGQKVVHAYFLSVFRDLIRLSEPLREELKEATI
ncbi:MAG: hypothetical protein J7527_18755, partial [Chitinophagaceae bacterium]|nr:hypothetical protein [Chitinophagaceae bacterium]